MKKNPIADVSPAILDSSFMKAISVSWGCAESSLLIRCLYFYILLLDLFYIVPNRK